MRNIDTRKLCEINDVLYKINRNKLQGPIEIIVTTVKYTIFGNYVYYYNDKYFFNKAIGYSLFKTKEEAENELEKLRKCAIKRKLMKEYEKKLNEELKIDNHIIIK